MALRARANGAPKVRKRWCVLDATRLTLYRTRSRSKVKDRIQLDPRTVALVTPPFRPRGRAGGGSTGGSGGGGVSGGGGGRGDDATNERDAIALVCFNMPAETGTLVIRAESIESQDTWVRALAARLTSRDHHARMAELYGGGADDSG